MPLSRGRHDLDRPHGFDVTRGPDLDRPHGLDVAHGATPTYVERGELTPSLVQTGPDLGH